MPDVFLSSAFRGFAEQRNRIYEIDPGRIWTVERERPDLDQRKGASPFMIVDELVTQVKKSSLFICVLRDVYGSSVFGEEESVSFLETEIYEAVLFHNNIRFFLMEPFNPPPKLKGLLDLVRALRPGFIPEHAQPETVVYDQIRRALDERRLMRFRPWSISLRSLVGQLAIRRGYPSEDVELFNRVFRSVSEKPDPHHIRTLIDGLKGEDSIQKRMTRTWIAIRELCAAPYDDPKFKEYLPLWNEALGVWSSAAAWYGLHGHLHAGRLAAVNSQLTIRQRMDTRPDRDAEYYIQGTKGARASEYYSIAKLMPTVRQRDQYLALALKDIDDALKVIADNPSGYLAIRGHVHLMQGQLDDALADFERSKELKERGGDEGPVGEAEADIALVYMRRGELRKATALLREGLAKLERTGRLPFALRVKRRLAIALLKSGHPFQALDELEAAYELAMDKQIYDQVTKTVEIAHWLATKIGRNRR
jgi:tetratricopeptide (TPR) repeat protein